MKIAPLKTIDPWFSHVANHHRAFVETLSGVPVEAVILMEDVSVLYDADRNYRPFLQLRGQLTGVCTPEVELPYGVTVMEFEPGHGPHIDAFYEFDNDQLASLVHKGYFETNFEVPASIIGIPWILPATAKLLFVSPETMDEPPIVFLEIDNANDLRVDAQNSGYELAVHFPNYTAELDVQRQSRAEIDRDAARGIGFDEADLSFDTEGERLTEDLTEGERHGGAFEQSSIVDSERVAEPAPDPSVEERREAEMDEKYQRNIAASLAAAGRHETTERASLAHQGYALFDDGFFRFESDVDAVDIDGDLVFEADDQFLAEIRAFESDAEQAQEVAATHDVEVAGDRLDVGGDLQTALQSSIDDRHERDARLAALQAERDAHAATRSVPAQAKGAFDTENAGNASWTTEGEIEFD
ncbi:hypothetical protein [Arthrobacter bambusae]|uniref:Uncharacterized protein n=1 Tax=Arthrobacter bambusae TaxID=1338426 RepID=A0AAW8DB91_9MICC|nr:hypothetical protein [Arthrobacter bambusae]MDP9903201.1 hypothetical protein [Arthrobacter bambusae]MDQ0128805.1 hypothetical protein [Arthrobacter bambusae]MDQ0180146.1 hypothetical protein [Arthrobacter bambusae]